jgi:FtsP/CotA-like multicopper oxidase with cupredoxin domain
MSSAEGDAQNPSQSHAGGQASDGSGAVPKDPYFEKAQQLPAWTVVHLHGGRTQPDSDGWTENAVPRGGSKTSHYDTHLPHGQHAPMLWFHDHAMGVTRLNVYAGLAGVWLIRDERDHSVMAALKSAHKDSETYATPLEIPLVFADRNLQTVDGLPDSALTGRLLLKTDDGPALDAQSAWQDRGPMEFFGPFTLVNGRIWPHCTVLPRPYRLRVLNASNARVYQLVLAKVIRDTNGERLEAVLDTSVVRQIGSDGGLFRHAVSLPARNDCLALTLAPGERADLLLDLSTFADGTNLRWINTAVAPFDGASSNSQHGDPAYLTALGEPDLAARVPYPQVMEWRVRGEKGAALHLPNPLCDYAPPPPHNQLGDHTHRLIVLAEQADPMDTPPPGVLAADWKTTTVLSLREMELIGFVATRPTGYETSSVPLIQGSPAPGEIDIDFFIAASAIDSPAVKHHRCRYRTLAAMFHDTVNFMVRFGATEVWNILNLTGDVHPFHVHLVQFQHYGRDGSYTLSTDPFPSDDAPGPVATYQAAPTVSDENELGWKDTMRANPGELLKIVAKFDGFVGRYMYHCHILEHEDHEMMRPFVVVPGEILDLMSEMKPMPGMHK